MKKDQIQPENAMRPAEYFQVLGLAIVVALVIKLFVVDAVLISSSSMEYTLMPGDAVLVSKISASLVPESIRSLTGAELPLLPIPRFGGIHRGDVVVFSYPGGRDDVSPPEEDIRYVKRCVAVGGDKIVIRGGKVLVNGVTTALPGAWHEPRFGREDVDNRLFPPKSRYNLDEYGPLYVPKAGDIVYLTPANFPLWETLIRREGHSIEQTPDGKFILDGMSIASYEVERNYVFVLGDNFYNSNDSRFFGFVPEENVIGEVLGVYWSTTPAFVEGEVSDRLSLIRWDRIGMLVQ